MEKFKLAKFKFDTAAQEKIILPPYKGSTFRGGFGYIFKKIVCVNKGQDCQDCLLREKCLYISIFETPPPEGTQMMRKYTSIPRPFVIEPPLDSKREYSQGEKLNFSLILIGKAIQYLPYFIFTFQELGKKGIGKGRERYSSRQDRRMKLGGFVGEITYKRENLKEFLPYILLGSYTLLGKTATFGLGKYEIVAV